MKLLCKQGVLAKQQVDAWIYGVYEGAAAEVSDCPIDTALRLVMELGDFTGKLYETKLLYPQGAAAKKLILVGMGKPKEIDMEKVRGIAGSAIKVALQNNVVTAAMTVFGEDKMCPKKAAQALAEGAILTAYNYNGFKSKKTELKLDEVLVITDAKNAARVEIGLAKGTAMAAGTNLARTLTAAPANYMTPTTLTEKATKVAAKNGLGISILDIDHMRDLGMGCLLGVAQGSAEPPMMIVLKYEGNPGGDILALVGKGITFDSGGISLKPGAGMEAMKGDMAGAAAVIGAMEIIGKLKPKTNVIGVIAATENMPDGMAQKPSDVVCSMMGKTIEIISTDAEGRLVLADAVAYAENLGAKKIVDVATLTGACARAFGGVYAGYIATCDDLSDEIQKAAALSGERYWRMPIHEDYAAMYKSDVADLKNSGGAGGGMQTGGMIIAEFIKAAAFVHLDIAGTSGIQADKPYMSKGFTGMATRTLAELALAQEK